MDGSRRMARAVAAAAGCLVFVLAGPARSDTPPPPDVRWTGALQGCSSGSNDWSDGGNWVGCGTCPPTSGDVALWSGAVCDPCEFCACLGVGCFPECITYECSGGPNDGLSCETIEDCDCCEGGSYVVDYDFTSGSKTFDDIYIWATNGGPMTLRKVNNGSTLTTTGIVDLKAAGSNKAILDVDANGFNFDRLESCGLVDITGAGTAGVDIGNYFQAGSSCAVDTTLTVTDGVEIDAGGQETIVRAASSKKSTLLLDEAEIVFGDVSIIGGGGATTEAKLEYNSPTTHSGITGLVMRGYSWLDVNVQINLGGDGIDTNPDPLSSLTVDTNGAATLAKVDMHSASTLWATNVNVTSASDDTATLQVISGTIKCPGTVTLTGSESGGSDAVLELPNGNGALTLVNIILNERGVLDLEESVTITGTLTITADSDIGATPGAELKFLSNVILTADQVKIDGGASGVVFKPAFVTNAKVQTTN